MKNMLLRVRFQVLHSQNMVEKNDPQQKLFVLIMKRILRQQNRVVLVRGLSFSQLTLTPSFRGSWKSNTIQDKLLLYYISSSESLPSIISCNGIWRLALTCSRNSLPGLKCTAYFGFVTSFSPVLGLWAFLGGR